MLHHVYEAKLGRWDSGTWTEISWGQGALSSHGWTFTVRLCGSQFGFFGTESELGSCRNCTVNREELLGALHHHRQFLPLRRCGTPLLNTNWQWRIESRPRNGTNPWTAGPVEPWNGIYRTSKHE